MKYDSITGYREDFPALKTKMQGRPLVFLDSAASAQKPAQVTEAMSSLMKEGYANIHRGLYELSQEVTGKYEKVREKAAGFIGSSKAEEIVFTRNSTEAINLVAQSWGRKNLRAGDEIILTEMEHHANIVPWQLLRDQTGIVIKVIPVNQNGELELDKLYELLSEKTRLAAFVHISNSLGTINPAAEIVKRIRAYNKDIKVLVDGSQAAVHTKINVSDIGCDFYVYTGHKIYGPTGIGVLYGRSKVLEDMPPFNGGGDMIETVSFEKTTYKEPPHRFEAGTPPIIEVIGLGAAIDYMNYVGIESIQSHENDLLEYGTQALSEIPGLKIYGNAAEKASILSFNIEGIHPDDIAMVLDQCGIAVRTGHHCCMPLMKKMGIEATVRASMALYSSREDLDRLVEGLHKAVKILS
jgi:cysteine desulfurase/selenocysteine lyase